MGQEAYLSEIMALTSTQQEALFGNLMRLGARRDLHGRKIRWDELPVLYPELATYNAALYSTFRLSLDVAQCRS